MRCRDYPVTGSTITELAGQLDRIVDSNDKGRFAASTDWFVRWRYAYTTSSRGCSVSSPTVSLRLTFVVPHWKAPAEVDEALVEQWNRFYAALWRHERGHVRHGLDAADGIRKELVSLGEFRTCKELESHADVVTQRVIERYRAKDRRYDATTAHGETQGALLIRS